MTYEEKCIRFAFAKLYMKACKEQFFKDARIVSPKMKSIEDLKEWYFSKEQTSIDNGKSIYKP